MRNPLTDVQVIQKRLSDEIIKICVNDLGFCENNTDPITMLKILEQNVNIKNKFKISAIH